MCRNANETSIKSLAWILDHQWMLHSFSVPLLLSRGVCTCHFVAASPHRKEHLVSTGATSRRHCHPVQHVWPQCPEREKQTHVFWLPAQLATSKLATSKLAASKTNRHKDHCFFPGSLKLNEHFENVFLIKIKIHWNEERTKQQSASFLSWRPACCHRQCLGRSTPWGPWQQDISMELATRFRTCVGNRWGHQCHLAVGLHLHSVLLHLHLHSVHLRPHFHPCPLSLISCHEFQLYKLICSQCTSGVFCYVWSCPSFVIKKIEALTQTWYLLHGLHGSPQHSCFQQSPSASQSPRKSRSSSSSPRGFHMWSNWATKQCLLQIASEHRSCLRNIPPPMDGKIVCSGLTDHTFKLRCT